MNVNELVNEIIERLKQMEEVLVIDRFESNIAVCEDRKTGKVKEIPKENIEEGLKEGDIIKFENGKYVQNKELQKEIEQEIKQKMNKVWED